MCNNCNSSPRECVKARLLRELPDLQKRYKSHLAMANNGPAHPNHRESHADSFRPEQQHTDTQFARIR